MCATAAGKILKINGNTAVVDINGRFYEVRIDLIEAKVGDRVYCAAGMAVEKAE